MPSPPQGTGGDPVKSAQPGRSGRVCIDRRALADPLCGLALAPPPPTLSLESGERNESPCTCGRPQSGRGRCHPIPPGSLARGQRKMNTAPRLTIGLPVYNGEKYIAESLDALLGQRYTDFELIISDNASTDSTGDICRQYEKQDSRVRYVRQPQNIGLARATISSSTKRAANCSNGRRTTTFMPGTCSSSVSRRSTSIRRSCSPTHGPRRSTRREP